MKIKINTTDLASPLLTSLANKIRGEGRVEMNRVAGVEVQEVTRVHVEQIASSRHKSSSKLGASPSNFFSQAVEKIASSGALQSDASGATLTINHVGFIRAFRDVEITPKSAKALAIPIHSMSYGKRAAELWDRLNLFIPKGKRVISANLNGVVTPLYILAAKVTQPQDRSLLPTEEEWRNAALAGIKGYFSRLIGNAGGLN